MRDVIQQLSDLLASGTPAAYCRLVETRGSTPQKAGATMLVMADGSQAGTLGGGCVEAEVKRRAIAAINDRRAEVSVFQLDSDYGWDDGLICGGRMKVLIQPLTPGDNTIIDYFRAVTEQVPSGGTEAVVYDSSSMPCPASVLFDSQGRQVAAMTSGDVASASLDAWTDEVAKNLKPLEDRPRPYATGGVAYLPWLTRCRLIIVGGGHVGQAVAQLADQLDFDVWVVDDRADCVSEQRFPNAQRRIHGKIEEVLPDLEITSDTYCLIVTRGHQHDERALYFLADRGARYVGLIGSRRKIKMIFEDLLVEGISAEALEGVYAPLGIHIGSQTVPEIAVSICAELVSHRNLGTVPGRPAPVTTQKSG